LWIGAKGGGMRLQQIVPWGRSYGEYRRTFGLSDGDLAYGDGTSTTAGLLSH
jgi:hypothetical protein